MVDQSEKTYRIVNIIDGKFDLHTQSIPKPGAGEVLIQVEYSTVNPIDQVFFHIQKDEGFTLGTDGSGTIVEVGDGVADDLKGKRVAFLNGGWSEYKVDKVDNLLILDDSQDLAKAANAFVNPLTASGMLDYAKEVGAKVAIVSAAGASLGQQFIKLAKSQGIDTIGVVRRDEQVKLLKDIGALHALNQTSESYFTDLEKLIADHKPTVFFDFVGGKTPAEIFHRMPPGSHMNLIGSFSHEPIPVDSGNILFQGKHITGFTLFRWLVTNTPEHIAQYKTLISNDLRDGGAIFSTTTAKTLGLADWQTALAESGKVSSEGKILLKIQP